MAVTIELDAQGVPFYSVTYEGKAVVNNSRLGFELIDGSNLKSGFEFVGESRGSVDETWSPVWGEEATIRNNYNELLLNLRQPETGRLLDLRFRVFDDGVGFRYEFPSPQPDLHSFIITDELTQFAIPEDATAFWIPGDFDSQEFNYTRSRLSE
ncbi:MAG: glycoside hydrolase family 97 N-terminal domain-containing protein, partial [Muribaculaceae bacterium]|nr:glycoside hydrolase family 97 N-terminal domain-containing protein [Muribaculaceae bacterium]